VAFHVQVRHSFRRAWLFNLSAERLRVEVVDPWIAGRELELGDRRWQPRESDLRVIEGPELAPPDLAHGQGWNAAERSGREVTRELLATAPPPVQVVVVHEGQGARVLLETTGTPAADFLNQAADALRALAGGNEGPVSGDER
jgi:hypothetical protein